MKIFKNRKLQIALYSIIMAAVYPLIYVYVSSTERADSTDAAGRGMIALGIMITVFFIGIAYFIISIIFSRIFLRSWLPPFIALLLLLLGLGVMQIPDYIDSLPKKQIVYYEDGTVRREGKADPYSGHWVGWVKSYRRDGTLWKEEYINYDTYENRRVRFYYGDGTLKSAGEMTWAGSLSSRIGEWKFYRPDGTLDDIRTYDVENSRIASSKNYRLYTDGVCIFHIGSGRRFTGMLKNTPVVYLDNDTYVNEEATYPCENEEDEEEIAPALYTVRVRKGVTTGPMVIRYATAGHPLSFQTVLDEKGVSHDYPSSYYPNGQISSRSFAINDTTTGYIEYYKDAVKHRPHGARQFYAKYSNGYVRDTAYWYDRQGKLRAWAVFKEGEVLSQWSKPAK
ncbi:MAG: hypothetical protein K6A82_05040 [Prevotella sp.]|nr:hypothetical protein [Prevotella sp.]